MLTLIQLHRFVDDAVVPEHYAELEVTAIPRIDETVVITGIAYTVLDVIHDYDSDDISIIMSQTGMRNI